MPRVRLMAKKKQKTQKSEQARAPSPRAKKPLVLPRVSKKANLRIKELDGLDAFTVDGVLTREECKLFVDAATAAGWQWQGSGGAAAGEAFRDNERVQSDDPDFAAAFWRASGLQELFQELDLTVDGMTACGLNPNIRLYRYSKGQRFGKHVDGSYELGQGRRTVYTLLVYLSGGESLKGGETAFFKGERKSRLAFAVHPEPGMALLHAHGDRCLEHEGAPVAAGVKYVLRSDVVFQDS
ncbi:unnamed protein product [Pedinophyceae sp. YPF-701]|nr:unnamed protein product [Pedinophyceae sp. YPF-701]